MTALTRAAPLFSSTVLPPHRATQGDTKRYKVTQGYAQ